MSGGSHEGWKVRTLAACLVVVWGGACMTDGTIKPNNAPMANAGEDQQVPFDGSPASVTLDGSGSRDPDGTVTSYIWASAEPSDEDAGARPRGPNPADKKKPTVELAEGQWTFQLWVEDDEGAISLPDYVTILVGEPEPSCVPDECPTPVMGEACCTSSDTGEEPGDARGRGPDLCGTDLGAVIPTLDGTCLQLEQPGEESEECPDVMVRSLEAGCCTDEGFCGGFNTTAGLGCHYPLSGPGGSCGGG